MESWESWIIWITLSNYVPERKEGRERWMETGREEGRRKGWSCVGDKVIIMFSKRL